MSNTSVVSTVRVGMNTDLHNYNMEKGQYSFALNADVEDFSGNGMPLIQNNSSNYLAINFPAGYKVLGKKYILELDITIFFLLDHDIASSQIGYSKFCKFNDSTDLAGTGLCEDCTNNINIENVSLETIVQTPYCVYNPVITSDCLAFDINHPIDVEYRIVNNSLYIYFVDNLNNLRYLYFDIVGNTITLQDSFKVITGYDADNCNQPIYSDELDCNKISYNPDFTTPYVDNVEDTYGGSLRAGVYEVLVAYSDVLGNPLTSYFAASAPYPLRTRDITIETNYNTGKGISFQVENLDQSGVFQYYNIVIAETVDNFTTFHLIGTVPITNSFYTYTGNSDVIADLTEDQVFFNYGIYQTARSITKANDYLFFAGLKPYKRLNLQQAVNRIKVYWQSIAISETDLKKPHNVSRYRGFLRDEVYPLGLVFEFDGDNDSIVFPLVGPAATDYTIDVNAIVDNNDVISNVNCTQAQNNKTWQVYNTGTIEGFPHEVLLDCDENKVWEWGKFSYWESEDLYPNIPEVWGDLCGQPIRHFKFPDCLVTHFHDGFDATRNYEDNNIVYPIGVRIDYSSVVNAVAWAVDNEFITQEDASKIKGFRIVRGNRFGNKSIQSKGYLYDVWHYEKDLKTIYYSNFPYNDLNPDIFLAPDDSTYNGSNDSPPVPTPFDKTGRYTYHSPDTHFTNSALGDILKLESDEYGTAEGYFNNCEGQPKYKILSTAARSLCFGAGVATAMSSITKQCRTITRNKLYVSLLGLASGTVEVTDTQSLIPPGVLKYNSLVTGIPEPLPDSVALQDCRGTAYQWLNPAMAIELAPQNPIEAGIMLGVIALGEALTAPLYFLAQVINEVDIFTKLLQSLTPAKNYFIQYNSIGKYNSYEPIENNGNKIRKLEYATYLESNLEYVDEPTGAIIYNNKDRESSVFLKTDSTKPFFPDPQIQDASRISMDSAGLGKNDLNKRVYTPISSYYASIKNYVPKQYGSIYSIEYLETNSQSFQLNQDISSITFFGGDTFISRMGLKIKHPFFIQTRYGFQDNSDVEYSKLGNVAYPNYYIDYGEGLFERFQSLNIGDIFNHFGTFFENLVGVDETRLDAKEEKFFYQSGYVHLYNYGIPYFLVESDVNVDYRYGQNDTDKDYYPHQKDLGFWLQEQNVPISVDNFYSYNTSYSKQNKESELQTIKPNTLFGDKSLINDSNLLLYTERAKTLNEGDNWKILRPDSFFRTDTVYGSIISIDGIESDKVLIRCENGSQIFNAYDTVRTSNGEAQIANESIFASRPREFAVTHLGYMGSQNRDILDTEFGHIFVDAKRGNVFNLANGGEGLEELCQNGMKNWFKNNLPFYIKKDFPNLTIDELDNSYNGLGIALGFDRRFNRFYLTKLDYKLKDDRVLYDGEYYIPTGITTEVCPTGYTLDNHQCKGQTTSPAEQISELPAFVAVSRTAEQYSSFGSCIYSTFAVNGTGTYEIIDNSATNNFWIATDATNGPLNRCGIWNSLGDEPYNVWVGVTADIEVPATKIYYIGIAGDNAVKIKIGCEVILDFDPVAVATNHDTDTQATFKYWHIYPVVLQAGRNLIELYGENYDQIAVFGAEIYDNTAEELMAANSIDDLNIKFTTADLIGQTIDNFNYTCSDCSSPVKFGNNYYCVTEDIKDPTLVEGRTVITLGDPLYFENKGWTTSYNFYTKMWTSFHSFIPNYYIDYIDYFQSGLNDSQSTTWSHGVSNKSYQVYYGKLYPFIIDIPTQFSLVNNNLNSIEYINDVLRYQNEYDYFNNSRVTFNKAIVYNGTQNSGLLNLTVKNESDLEIKQNKIVNNYSRTITVSNSEGFWRFNDFFDVVKSQYNNIPLWLYDSSNVNKQLNNQAFDFYKKDTNHPLIRGRVCNVRLINDVVSNYHFMFMVTAFNQTESIR